MRGGNVVEYIIRAWDRTKEGLSSALSNLKRHGADSRRVIEETNEAVGRSADATEAYVERMAKSAGRLPGVFGRVQHALTGLAGKIAAVIGAFKVGWDIGKWIDENVIVPLFGIKEPIDELKKKNRELAKSAEEAANKWAAAQEELASSLERHAKAAGDAVSQIDKLAAAYLRLQDARKAVADAGNDAAVLSLQRDKFEDMLSLGREGKAEQAAQVGKYYDVMIAEKRKERAVADADAAIERAESAIETNEQKIAALRRRELVAEQDYKKAKARLEQIDDGDVDFAHDKRRYESELKKARRDVERAERNRDRLADQRRELTAERETLGTTLAAKQAERANAEERANLEIDAKKKAYDDYLDHVAKEDEERAEEWAKETARLEERQLQDEERQRSLMEARLHKQRVQDAREEANARADEAAEAQSRLAAARNAASRAWGWYRDKDSLRAQIDEEKAEAAAQAQFEKDLDSLKRRKGSEWRGKYDRESGTWRTAKEYSIDDEAVRRVALAREEEKAAEQYAQQTAEASQRAADALEQLVGMAEGGDE